MDKPDKPIEPRVDIGHVHLKVADIERALAFYQGVLGFELTQRMGDSAAFLSAGGYHHHIGLNTWESRGGKTPRARHDGSLSLRDSLPQSRDARRRASPARQGRRPPRGCRRPRRQRGALSARPRRERPRALLGSPAVRVAARRRRLAPHGDRAAEPDAPARRGAGRAGARFVRDRRSSRADDRGRADQARRSPRRSYSTCTRSCSTMRASPTSSIAAASLRSVICCSS